MASTGMLSGGRVWSEGPGVSEQSLLHVLPLPRLLTSRLWGLLSQIIN